MDSPQEGYLLIVVVMAILITFLAALLTLMLAYRRRRKLHAKEVEIMKEKYQKEILETQVEIQKETMQQIGREIHDNVGQKLTLAVLYTEHLNLGKQDNQDTEKISSIGGLINESLSDLRALSQDLSRTAENPAELEVLLQKEVGKIKKTGRCDGSFNSSGERFEIPIAICNMLLRIVQEFVQNSLKHAECSSIRISVDYSLHRLALLLADDGIGFEYPSTESGTGIGIDNMKKRAGQAGAELTIQSAPGNGTVLQVFVPFEKLS